MSRHPVINTTRDLNELVFESVDFLREHEPPEGYFVGFSGGKDSIVTLALCRLAGVRHQAFYSCTRIDPPEVVRFIQRHYPTVEWIYPKLTFWEGIKKKGPPTYMQRWCCDALKKRPAYQHPLKHRIMGIRAEESARRASYPRISQYRKVITYKPLFEWPEWAVWEFIDAERLAYPSLYDEGFGRIGCVVCPYSLGPGPATTRQREVSMQRWPGLWKAYEKAVKTYYASAIEAGKHPGGDLCTNADEYWEAYLLGFKKKKEQLR